jgi:uncharacterized Zn-finger protein
MILHDKSVHAESRNFVCDYCGKGFKRADGLKEHLRTHNTDDSEKAECSVCGKLLSIFLVLKSKFTRLTFKLNFIITDFEVFQQACFRVITSLAV